MRSDSDDAAGAAASTTGLAAFRTEHASDTPEISKCHTLACLVDERLGGSGSGELFAPPEATRCFFLLLRHRTRRHRIPGVVSLIAPYEIESKHPRWRLPPTQIIQSVDEPLDDQRRKNRTHGRLSVEYAEVLMDV